MHIYPAPAEVLFETEHLVVGAGVSGIALARRLMERGRDFQVIEKSAGVGGRVATRRDQNAKFDHGAQFLKNGNQSFGLPEYWSKQGLLTTWFQDAETVYSCSYSGMNSLIKSAAQDFFSKVRLNTRLRTLRRAGDGSYLAETDEGLLIAAERVYLTCPLPQSLKILDESSIAYPADLSGIEYAHALVGLFILRKESFGHQELSLIEAFKFQERISNSISSVSNQWSKGLGLELGFTHVMSASWSKANFGEEDAFVLENMTRSFCDFLGQLTKSKIGERHIDRRQLKRWRYSHPLQSADSLHMSIQPGLILLGDAFGGASINGAIRSAESIDLGQGTSRS